MSKACSQSCTAWRKKDFAVNNLTFLMLKNDFFFPYQSKLVSQDEPWSKSPSGDAERDYNTLTTALACDSTPSPCHRPGEGEGERQMPQLYPPHSCVPPVSECHWMQLSLGVRGSDAYCMSNKCWQLGLRSHLYKLNGPNDPEAEVTLSACCQVAAHF